MAAMPLTKLRRSGDDGSMFPFLRGWADIFFMKIPPVWFSIYSSAAFWKANLTGVSSAFLKFDRWIIMINATPFFMSIQA
jgi:hypothetical protein